MRRYTFYLFLENCSTCFEWYLHPSSGAHTNVFTASGTCQTVATCRYCGRIGNISRTSEPFIQIHIKQDATLHNLFISGKLFYMFQVVSPPIIRSTHNCIYSIWHLLNQELELVWVWCGNCIDLFWCGLHPSSGAHTTVFTASGTCQTKSWNWFDKCQML